MATASTVIISALINNAPTTPPMIAPRLVDSPPSEKVIGAPEWEIHRLILLPEYCRIVDDIL